MFSRYIVVSLSLWLACIGVVYGGIVVATPPTKDKAVSHAVNKRKPPDKAADLRNKAQAYKSGNDQIMPITGDPVIIQMDAAEEVEEGVLLPRNDETPAVSKARSHELSRDNIPAEPDTLLPAQQDAQPSGNNAAALTAEENKKQLAKNRFKASQYMKGKAAPSLVSQSKGDNVVACDSTGSTSGRIGDDSMSGREIVVIREGKQVRMRCR
jgi:hypothetical protein